MLMSKMEFSSSDVGEFKESSSEYRQQRRILELEGELASTRKDLALIKAVFSIVANDLQIKNDQLDLLHPNLSDVLSLNSSHASSSSSSNGAIEDASSAVVVSNTSNSAKSSSKRDYFRSLPQELHFFFVEFLDYEDLVTISMVCKDWSQITRNPRFWKNVYLSRWPFPRNMSDSSSPTNSDSGDEKSVSFEWKAQFRHRHLVERNWNHGKANVMTLPGHNGTVTCLQFDKSKLISGSDDGSLNLWKLQDKESSDIRYHPDRLVMQHHRQIRPAQRVTSFQGHGGPVWCLSFYDNTLVSGSYDRTVKVWNIRTGSCTSTLRGHEEWVTAVHLYRDHVLSGSIDANLKLWNLTANGGRGRCILTLQGVQGNGVNGLHWDPIAQRAVTGTRNSTVQLWDIAGSALISSYFGHDKQVYTVQMDEDKILSGAADKTVKCWDIRSSECCFTLAGHSNSVMSLQFDDASHRLVSGSYDTTLRTWDLRKLQAINVLEGHSSAIFSSQFDDTKIISGSSDRTIRIWNFST